MTAAESAAIIARAKGDSSAPLTTYESVPASPTYPYVAVYFDGGIASSDRECDDRVQKTIGFSTVTVGVSVSQSRDARDRLTGRLENWTPAVAGRQITKVSHEGTQPVREDKSLPDRVVFIATDQWQVVSDPA